jgi:hypothetical protein
MHIDHRSQRLRRGFAFLALAAVLGLSAVGLTQCRMIGDTVTGADARSDIAFSPGPHPTCIHRCNDEFRSCQEAEKRMHKSNLAACKQRPKPERNDCKKAENRRHEAAQKACVTAMQACKAACPGN